MLRVHIPQDILSFAAIRTHGTVFFNFLLPVYYIVGTVVAEVVLTAGGLEYLAEVPETHGAVVPIL